MEGRQRGNFTILEVCISGERGGNPPETRKKIATGNGEKFNVRREKKL